MSALLLLRHGQTRWNAAGRFQGQADPPLDPIGVTQARAAAVALALYAPRLVVSSDLRRASQTAAIVAAKCGVDVVLDPRLREIALGTWEGLDRRDASDRFPDEYAAWASGRDVRRGGGETEAEAGRRVVAALAAWGGGSGGAVVVVSHGLCLRSALRLVAPAQATHLDNCRWTVLTPAQVDLLSGSRLDGCTSGREAKIRTCQICDDTGLRVS